MPCTTITELPPFATPEEHQALTGTTPASFSEIRPVLRHKEENVSITLDPPLEGFSSEDGVRGTLFIIEKWVIDAARSISLTHRYTIVPCSSSRRPTMNKYTIVLFSVKGPCNLFDRHTSSSHHLDNKLLENPTHGVADHSHFAVYNLIDR